MIAELQPGASGGTGVPPVTKRYVWGLDLAGQSNAGDVGPASGRCLLESAGGIGGLLSVYDYNGTSTDLKYVTCYDANGNVTQLLDPAATTVSNALVARYEYDPYGSAVVANGTYAASNRWRFSTKTFDTETGLGYWGYRYYSPTTGRWLSRDPIGEKGGAVSIAFAASKHGGGQPSHGADVYVENQPISGYDPDGMQTVFPRHGGDPTIPMPPDCTISPGNKPLWDRQIYRRACYDRLHDVCNKYPCCKNCKYEAADICETYVNKWFDHIEKNPGRFHACNECSDIIKEWKLSRKCLRVESSQNMRHFFQAVFHKCNTTKCSDANLDPWELWCGNPTTRFFGLRYLPKTRPGCDVLFRE
ncbi:MAG: RHS repeat-associated core domain-containing protein [Planctomycetes bacterium]|nr:RHS repeat-associated core domain-containing protein [Planctomycetota bacterium]